MDDNDGSGQSRKPSYIRTSIFPRSADITSKKSRSSRLLLIQLAGCNEMPEVTSPSQTSIPSTLPSNSFSRGRERVPAESARAFRASCLYLSLGPGRSLDRAWRLSCAGSGGKNLASTRRPGQWSRWSAKYHWVDRAAAYDQLTEKERRSAEDERSRNRPEEDANRELSHGEQRGDPAHRVHAAGPGDPPRNHDRAGNKGRPSRITDQLLQSFCHYVQISGSIETAIRLTGIGRATYYRWQREERDGCASLWETEFIQAVETTCADTKMRCEQLLWKHMQKHWRAIAWWLERKYPNEYGRRRRLPPLPDWDPLY